MLAHLFAFGRKHHAILVFYRQTQFQRVNRVQTQPIAKQRGIGINILCGKLVQIQRGDYEILNFKIKRLHH